MFKNMGSKIRKLFTSSSKEMSLDAIVRRIQLFNHLNSEQFNSLLEKFHEKHFKAGEIIIHEGQLGDEFYILMEGSVRVYTLNSANEEIILARSEAGAFFGELALLDNQPEMRKANVKALTDVTVASLKYKDFNAAIDREQKSYHLLKKLGEKALVSKILQQSKLFSELNNKELLSLMSQEMDFSDHSVIFSLNEPADGAYFLVKGQVEITLANGSKTHVEEGQIFGEYGILKEQSRLGTATALGPVKVLFISASKLTQLYHQLPKLKEYMASLVQMYRIPSRGLVSTYKGNFLGMECTSSLFKLDNNDSFIASSVIGDQIFSLTKVDTKPQTILKYHEKDMQRELHLIGNIIVGVVCYGYWSDLGVACGNMLDEKPLETWQESLFVQSGLLELLETQKPGNVSDILCNCMAVTYGEVNKAILKGNMDTISIQQNTGASSVCGSCRPKIDALVGNSDWMPVYIDEVISHNAKVHSYRLKPYKNKIKSYKPGQHIIIQTLINNKMIERTYTLTSIPDNLEFLELTIKREDQGYFSRWLFDSKDKKPFIRISPPNGEIIPELLKHDNIVCFVAGIGITPALALARYIYKHNNKKIMIDYSISTPEQFIFRDEFNKMKSAKSNIIINERITSETGHIQDSAVADIISKNAGAQYYICGPKSYIKNVKSFLQNQKITPDNILTEEFIHAGGPEN